MNRLDRLLDLDSEPARNPPRTGGVQTGVGHLLKTGPGRLFVTIAAGAAVTAAISIGIPEEPTPPAPPALSQPSTPAAPAGIATP